MQVAYQKDYSRHLGRDMEHKRFGHAGRPVVMFPTSRGRFFQYEDTGTIGVMSDFIESGRIQVWTLDGIDGETFFGPIRTCSSGSAATRPISAMSAKRRCRNCSARRRGEWRGGAEAVMSGCSMGAFHSANFVFRFPELRPAVIALSGVIRRATSSAARSTAASTSTRRSTTWPV